MNSFSYRVYYKYEGPTKSDPFRALKNDSEIEFALSQFSLDLSSRLANQGSQVSSNATALHENSIIVLVKTEQTQSEVEVAVKECLNHHDLFGEKCSNP